MSLFFHILVAAAVYNFLQRKEHIFVTSMYVLGFCPRRAPHLRNIIKLT
jgi:hypothetical protein